MSVLRPAARGARKLVQRARFRVWAARLRAKLRRNGARLVLDAPHGAAFADPPRVELERKGEGEATFTLRLGRDVDLGRHTAIELWAAGTNVLELGEGTRLGRGVRFELRGGSIRLGPACRVRDVALLKSDGELRIGTRVLVGLGDLIACTGRVDIGDLTGLGEHVSVVDADHQMDGTDAHWAERPLSVEPVRLGRNVLVSAGVRILRGTTVGPNAVLAAGAVLTGGDHPGSWLIAGVPARPLRPLPAAEDAGESAPGRI
jgi:acetyltransferase-like isoleucine patch superfamily enzyme